LWVQGVTHFIFLFIRSCHIVESWIKIKIKIGGGGGFFF